MGNIDAVALLNDRGGYNASALSITLYHSSFALSELIMLMGRHYVSIHGEWCCIVL